MSDPLTEAVVGAVVPLIDEYTVDPYGLAEAVLSTLGVERLYLGTDHERPAWAHRWTIGDKVVNVSDQRRYERDIPLYRVRVLEP